MIRAGNRRFWLLFGGIMVVHFGLWAGWFTLAGRHPVAEVPLAARGR